MTWTLLIYLMIGAALEWAVETGTRGWDDCLTRSERLGIIFLWPMILCAALIYGRK